MKLRCEYLIALVVAAGLVLCLILTGIPVSAHPGLKVSGARLLADVAPGETIAHTMTVSTTDADPPMDILISVTGLGQSLDGNYQTLDASKDTSPYSARKFITLDKTSFHLKPGDSQTVTAPISIPSDVGAGGRYALIYIRSQPVGVGQVGIVTAVAVTIALTIKDSELSHKGKITGVSTSEAVSGQPVDILTTFEHTGNHHFKIRGEVTISDSQGKTLDTIHIPLISASVIPTMSRQLKATFISQGELPLGVYSVKSKVMLEDGTVLDEASGSFEVKEPYVPPPPPASITLTPSSAAVLKTTDERISISFPQGAVISQVEISVQNYPLEQLTAPPAGFNLATTCFRIDGLAGLLAKEAMVTVKYTAADLDKAEGDVSRLRLARWDETDNQWTVLKTKLDKQAMTLSTTTNQLSIWVVMVAPPAVMNWPLIGSIAAGVIVVALLVYFLAVRRRGY